MHALTEAMATQCLYRSIPPYFVHTTSSPKRGGGVFSSMQLVSIIRPLEKFYYVYDTAKVHVRIYKSTNDRQYCSWSSCVISLHRREERIFEGGVLAGHYGIFVALIIVLLSQARREGGSRGFRRTPILGRPKLSSFTNSTVSL